MLAYVVVPTLRTTRRREVIHHDWVETIRRSWTIRSQIQEMGENGAYSAHFV